ncbi:hypothetical protein KC19_6G044200 [Ceratodon purpureus]|uniref:Uncharacterized protein n=1 Tax=Ceratodon purpureus TaxID=3225 RepID=A0A8T0HF88_CERPU|nr:hypothetical protein KC19_6G044200 [Ceratodon purpureus]
MDIFGVQNALRHIFAEQTVEINVAQKWSRLAAVACPCNGLALMDESLQLLPVVDALDLSRNNFAKVANLQKCTRLKFLDLGFNHISSVASLNQVVGTITKLVLRNNALVSTRGIETLLSLEALDLSHNIISNFHEVEALGFLPALQSLWLNGNPISVSSHYREEVFSYFHNPSKLEVDGKPMTKLESWFMRGILSRRIKQRASYGIYVPAKSSDVPLYDAGPSEALLPQSRQAPKKKSTRLASIDDTGASKLAAIVESAQQDLQAAGAEPEISSPGASEAREQVDPEVAQLIQQIENMKREGSSTWLNDLVGFWESESRSPGGGDKMLGNSDSGSWSQRRRRGKEEVRRRLEDVAVPKDLREAVLVLETVTKSDMEDFENVDVSMSSLQMREDEDDGLPASPPHYDSALMHRRQNLVNEMLRLPLDLSTSSDGDSDSIDDHQADSVSDRTNSDPSSPLSVVDKQIDFQELTSKFHAAADKAQTIKDIDEDPGTSTPVYSDMSEPEIGKNEKGKWKTVSMAEESSSPVQSPQKSDDVVTNSGGSARKRKQKKSRRIVILDPEDDVEETVGLKGPLLNARGYQTDIASQLAAPPSSLARNLSQPFMSNRSSSSGVKRSSSALPGMVKRISSSLAKTVEIASNLGNVNTSRRQS